MKVLFLGLAPLLLSAAMAQDPCKQLARERSELKGLMFRNPIQYAKEMYNLGDLREECHRSKVRLAPVEDLSERNPIPEDQGQFAGVDESIENTIEKPEIIELEQVELRQVESEEVDDEPLSLERPSKSLADREAEVIEGPTEEKKVINKTVDPLFVQLTTPEKVHETQEPFIRRGEYGVSQKTFEISQSGCEKLRFEQKKLLPLVGTQKYLDGLQDLEGLRLRCFQQAQVDRRGEKPQVVRIDMFRRVMGVSDASSSDQRISREFRFMFEQRKKQNMKLDLRDQVMIGPGKGRNDSAGAMMSSIVFIPRKVIPYVQNNDKEGTRTIYLPTGEPVVFNSSTNEITGGVLREGPIDLNPSRHARRFAEVEYIGTGITVRADRRGGNPEYVYSSNYNPGIERPTEATVTYRGNECYVPKALIWERRDNLTFFKYSTDQEFLDKVVNPKCGWNLTLEDLE